MRRVILAVVFVLGASLPAWGDKVGSIDSSQKLEAVPGMIIPNAATRSADGKCVFTPDATTAAPEGVVINLDPDTCTATVIRAGKPDSTQEHQLAPEVPPPSPLPSPSKKRRGTTNEKSSSFETDESGLYALVPCPRQEIVHTGSTYIQRFKRNLYWSNMIKLRARSKYWVNTRSWRIGEIHPFSPPMDWGAWSITSWAFTRGWRMWLLHGFGPIGQDGPSSVSSYINATFRAAHYFSTNETAKIYVDVVSGTDLVPHVHCNISGAVFTDGYTHRMICKPRSYLGAYQACYF